MRNLLTIIGFLLFIFGFLGIILGLVNVQLQFLAFLERFGNTVSFTVKFLMIIIGIGMMYYNLPKTKYL
jgi:hypothetical protein